MTRPLRIRDPEGIFLVTVRTSGAAIWMVPHQKLNATLGGILARYQEMSGVEIFAYCFLGNHYHLLIRAPKGNLDEFCENVNREVARRVNKVHGRKGQFWGRRYDAQLVIEEADQLEALTYIITNPVHHGLVRSSLSWPGLGCYKHIVSEIPSEFTFKKFVYVKKSGRKKSNSNVIFIEPQVMTHKLILSPIPALSDCSKGERVGRIRDMVHARSAKIIVERETSGRGFLEAKAILQQPAGKIPRKVSNSPRPACYTKNIAAHREFVLWYRGFRSAYNHASEIYRKGQFLVDFPINCYRPPAHRVPNDLSFKESS